MMIKMCFAIPYKVLKVKSRSALLEGGQIVKLGQEIKIKKGDYLNIIGNIAVGSFSAQEGLKIRQQIKQLNN
ncbi:hypothetical protein FJY90_06720 [Candidatus Gottesmanbacteria bacterium]|nr:hypothetical protein [Candidatus Gottesmanbacteria bacterium]